MVAGGHEGIGQAGEDALAVVVDLRRLAVHEVGGRNHLAAVGLADALIAQADAEDRDLAGQLVERRQGDAAVFGAARPGGDEDGVGPLRPDALHVDGVVAEDEGIGPELAQLLDQVVDEGVVVVDDQDPGSHEGGSVPSLKGATGPG